MKVWLYGGGQSLAQKSGIGKAYLHQKEALSRQHIPYTEQYEPDVDILQVNTIFPDTVWQVLAAKRKGIKVVYYAHSTKEDFCNSFLGSNLLAGAFKRWICYCYELGDVIVTPTCYSREILEGYGLRKPIFSISNGICLEEYRREDYDNDYFVRKFGFARSKKVVMSVGHFFVRKGILDFIAMAERMPEQEFVWFGSTKRSAMSVAVKKAMANAPANVHFPGYVDGEELKAAYASCDLFCFLSHEETEGIVLLEAMAMKCPVLIRNIPIYENLWDRIDVYKGRTVEEFTDLACCILEGLEADLTENAYRRCQKVEIGRVGGQLKEVYDCLRRDGMAADRVTANRVAANCVTANRAVANRAEKRRLMSAGFREGEVRRISRV